MNRSAKTPLWEGFPHHQSGFEKRPKQSATSLSFPDKPPGAHPLSSQLESSHAIAFQASVDVHRRQVKGDSFNHHRHYWHPDLVDSLPVQTVDEEEEGNIAIHGSQSFAFHYDDQVDLCGTTCVENQLAGSIQFVAFSDSLTKHDPYHNPISSVSLPFYTPIQRSLTSMQNDLDHEMTTTATTAPNSPPDLSGSKSSKSSSSRSSQFDGPDSITNDVSNFEEIGLEEGADGTCEEHAQWGPNRCAKRSSSRVSLISARAPLPSRDSNTIQKRPTYPSLQGHVQRALSNIDTNSADLTRYAGEAATGGLKRGFTAPSSATLRITVPGCLPRTRSSSPSSKQPASASFATTGYNPRSGPPSRSFAPPSRRGSWQPSRKTIKELEAEYHDSDDELPDDASLWNVPMSPRPPTAHPSSSRSSNRGSPERDAIADGPQPLPLSHAVSAPASPPQYVKSQSFSRSRAPPRSSSLQCTTSSTNSPTFPNSRGFFPDTRTKSWTLAMAELSEEARVLTETLELHADNKGRIHEDNIQNGTKSSRSSLESTSKRSARSSAIELPPIQKGNILVDPMPVSKEKEAVLTRTRPSWLPPKDPREEKRHLKEYQRMMAASQDAEKRKEDRVRVRQYEKDDRREALNRIWEEYVYPEWDHVTQEHRTREIWWQGVSPKVRGRVWMRAIGNPLGLTHKSYTRALQRVKDLQARPMEDLSENGRRTCAWFSAIERDAELAFPELNLFQNRGPMWQELVDICCAYVCYRSDVGYLYGMQLIGALLLLQIPSPEDVFVLLANCLNGPVALAFLTSDSSSSTKALRHVHSTLQYKFPRLHSYLFRPVREGGLDMHPAEVFEATLRNFLTNGLDIERLVRVWDCFVFEGDRAITQAAVALLGCLQTQIFGFEGSPQEKRRMVGELLGWGPTGRVHGYWDVRVDADSFMAEVKDAGKTNPSEDG